MSAQHCSRPICMRTSSLIAHRFDVPNACLPACSPRRHAHAHAPPPRWFSRPLSNFRLSASCAWCLLRSKMADDCDVTRKHDLHFSSDKAHSQPRRASSARTAWTLRAHGLTRADDDVLRRLIMSTLVSAFVFRPIIGRQPLRTDGHELPRFAQSSLWGASPT